jgi:AraC family transcriptional regulator
MSFHGTTVAEAEVDAVRYRTVRFGARHATPPHAHEQAYFCLVLDGVSRQRSGGGERVRRPGSVFFHPAGEPHSEEFGADGGTLFSVELGRDALARFRASLPADASFAVRGRAKSIAARLYVESRTGLETLEADALTQLLIGEAARTRDVVAPTLRKVWLDTARDYVHAHFASNIRLADVAAAASGVHPVHLSSEFRRRFGVTITGYVQTLRIERAQRELARTDLSIADIALDAGFSSQSHLTNRFRVQTGFTPAAWRALFQSTR